jgi:hypothetical protein
MGVLVYIREGGRAAPHNNDSSWSFTEEAITCLTIPALLINVDSFSYGCKEGTLTLCYERVSLRLAESISRFALT